MITSWLPGFARVPSLLPSSPPYLSSSLRASLPPQFFTLHPFLPLPHPYSLLCLLYLLPPSSQLPPFQLPYSYISPPFCFPSSLPPPFIRPSSSLVPPSSLPAPLSQPSSSLPASLPPSLPPSPAPSHPSSLPSYPPSLLPSSPSFPPSLPHPYSLLHPLPPPSSQLPPFQPPYSDLSPPSCLPPSSLSPPFLPPASSHLPPFQHPYSYLPHPSLPPSLCPQKTAPPGWFWALKRPTTVRWGLKRLLIFWAVHDISWTFWIANPRKSPLGPPGVGCFFFLNYWFSGQFMTFPGLLNFWPPKSPSGTPPLGSGGSKKIRFESVPYLSK